MKTPESQPSLADTAKKLGRLYLDGLRIGAAEKTSMLLSAMAWTLIRIFFAVVVLLFLGIFLMDLLDDSMARCWAALITLGFYAVTLFTVYALRRKLLYDPIARLISRIFFSAPKKDETKQ